MLGRLLRPAMLLLSLAAFLPAQAQTTDSQDSCEVIIPKVLYVATRQGVARSLTFYNTVNRVGH